jgi:hypothetical protein
MKTFESRQEYPEPHLPDQVVPDGAESGPEELRGVEEPEGAGQDHSERQVDELRERDRLLVKIRLSDYGIYDTDTFAEELLELREDGWSLDDIYERIEELNELSTNAVNWLRSELNIANFARYPVNLLKSIYESDSSKSWGLVAYARHDHNGALDDDHESLTELQTSLGDDVQPIIIEVESAKDVAELLSKLASKRGKASFCIVSAHGSASRVHLGDDSTEGTLGNGELSGEVDLGRTLDENLRPEAEIVFFSCNVGKSKGIAEQVSKKANRVVIAAVDKVHGISYGAHVSGGAVTFDPEFQGAATRTIKPNDVESLANPEGDQETPGATPETV